MSPEFPNYQNPATLPASNQPPAVPQGIPFVDDKYHKPLYKMMKAMMKNGKRLGKMTKMSRLKKPKKVKVM